MRIGETPRTADAIRYCAGFKDEGGQIMHLLEVLADFEREINALKDLLEAAMPRLRESRGFFRYQPTHPERRALDEILPQIERALEDERSSTNRAIHLIAEEFNRQEADENWPPQKDTSYTQSNLICAAATYLLGNGELWPWDESLLEGFNEGSVRCGSVKNLVKAGALIVAKINEQLELYDGWIKAAISNEDLPE